MMKRSTRRNHLGLMLCLAMLGSVRMAHADDDSGSPGAVRERLKTLQSNLDLMLANHQLTPDQYATETERVRQLRLQLHVDSQEQGTMTKEDQSTDFQLIRQISQEATQWSLANSSGAAVTPYTSLADLQSQYATLNDQYQRLDAKYISAVSARDFSTAQTLKAELDALRQQSEDVRSEIQQQISSVANP